MKTRTITAARQRGLTLIELMVAMTIGLLLLAGTASLFISNKRIYREQEELSRLQENGRFALEMLIRDIRMTGFVGCHDIMANVTNHVSTNAVDLTSYLARIEASDEAGDWLPSGATTDKGDFGDGVTVRYLSPLNMTLSTQSTSGAATPLSVASTGDLRDGELIAVGDCANSDVLAIDDDDLDPPDATETSIDNDAVMARVYDAGSQVMRFVARRYFIRDGGDGPALWVADKDGAQELIEGVETMQILYGLDDADADTLPNSYVNAAAAEAAGWDNVVSVRVALLLRTLDENVNNDIDTRVYPVLDQSVGPFNDQRRRRVFTATISIRNNT